MSRLVIAAVVVCLCTPPASAAPVRTRDLHRVRPLQKSAERALQDALHRSPTIVEQLERIERSDVIVYINFVPFLPRHRAHTTLISSTKQCRYLLISLDSFLGVHDLVPMLGHELQHVIEIANAPEVRDQVGVRLLFRRIGLDAGADDSFETEAARTVGANVRDELRDRRLAAWTAQRRALGGL